MRLVIGHGAGCFGHAPAQRYAVRQGLKSGGGWLGYTVTRRAVIELNGLVLDAMADQDLRPVAVQPSATAVARDGKLVSMDLTVIQKLLDAGQIPLVFGDAVIDEERGFTIVSTEGLLAYLAQALAPSRIIFACDVDGVFDSDPNRNDEARRIGPIDSENLEDVLAKLGAGQGADVTGGMAGKVKAAHELAWQCMDAEVRIVSGVAQDRVRDALVGRGGGTRIRP